MKKIFVLLLGAVVTLSAFAGNDKPIDPEKLPSRAREFITRHFPGADISLATVDRELFDTTYELFFTDGNKIEFDKKGQWKEINCKYSRIPDSALPKEIGRYMAAKHPGRYAKEIDRERNGYEVKLDNGLELKFDLRFRLTGYDD